MITRSGVFNVSNRIALKRLFIYIYIYLRDKYICSTLHHRGRGSEVVMCGPEPIGQNKKKMRVQ